MATPPHHTLTQPYELRANSQTHPLARYLFQLMALKKTNLCVSADVSTAAALLTIAEQVGDSICVLKTHCDIIEDWSDETAWSLKQVALRKGFITFEDRKFGDIGNTVQKQYTSGPFKIVRWASLTNAHIFPGPAVVEALKNSASQYLESFNRCVVTEITAEPRRRASTAVSGEEGGGDEDEDEDEEEEEEEEEEEKEDANTVAGEDELPRARKRSIVSTTVISTTTESINPQTGTPSSPLPPSSLPPILHSLGQPPLNRALLLLAQMSSIENLMAPPYTTQCLKLARKNRDFVAGFIAQGSLNREADDDFLVLTPGVWLPSEGKEGDSLGQRYRTPREVILNHGADVMIVGRGILDCPDRASEAERYRKEGWRAYEERIGSLKAVV